MVEVFGARVVGPLESYVSGFANELTRQGYTANGASQHLCFIAHLSRWMGKAGLDVSALTSSTIEQYLVSRRLADYTNYRSAKALRPLLDYLGSLGILPPPKVAALDPAHALLENYRRFLVGERGLIAASARAYVDTVRAFVVGRVHVDEQDLAGMSATDVTGFVLATCPAMANGSKAMRVTALRSLLNWLYVEGLIPLALAGCVPAVARRRLATIPKALEPRQVVRLLASCDRRRAMGRRDYAILLLLSRLGLRSGEVARLSLDDIDWRAGQFILRGKGNRAERLPVPADIGKAILDYLRRGRPRSAKGRSVFVRVKAPHRELTSCGVTMVVFDAGQRAGLGKLHAHRLRHTAATTMLRAGTPLAEVGQVLRHRRVLTTAIYAKVDRDALRALARPWPGGSS